MCFHRSIYLHLKQRRPTYRGLGINTTSRQMASRCGEKGLLAILSSFGSQVCLLLVCCQPPRCQAQPRCVFSRQTSPKRFYAGNEGLNWGIVGFSSEIRTGASLVAVGRLDNRGMWKCVYLGWQRDDSGDWMGRGRKGQLPIWTC